jgi:L-threonylcarbamoyladenylate synthase
VKLENMIKRGHIGVMPTDTIYGVVCSALQKDTVERVYTLKGRPAHKAFIILIGNIDQLHVFNIVISKKQKELLDTLWPGPNSVIFPCSNPNFEFLHRGNNTLAIRLPATPWLQNLISETGPIIATSANASGQPYKTDFQHIKESLPGLDFYKQGDTGSIPSSIYKWSDDNTLEKIERS